MSNSPYLVTGDVTIPNGITLTISPGVQVRFMQESDDQFSGFYINKSELIIDGSLVAIGTETDSITFLSHSDAPTDQDWGGFKCYEPNVVHLGYVSYRNAISAFTNVRLGLIRILYG